MILMLISDSNKKIYEEKLLWVGLIISTRTGILGRGGGGAVSIVFICMFIYMLLQVKSVDRSQ